MLLTVKGYYDGSKIVLDTPSVLKKGQKVIITYKASSSNKINNDSLVDRLTGAIPNSGKSLSEYRSERLKKYASLD